MTAFTTMPDIEAICSAAIRNAAIVAARVYSSIPKDPTFPLIVVERIGGTPAIRQRLDAATVQVSVWGGTKSQAHDAAQAARVALLELEGTAVTDPVAAFVTAVDDAGGMIWLPDPLTGRDRYLFTVSVYAHA